jgi:hypothetical protein
MLNKYRPQRKYYAGGGQLVDGYDTSQWLPSELSAYTQETDPIKKSIMARQVQARLNNSSGNVTNNVNNLGSSAQISAYGKENISSNINLNQSSTPLIKNKDAMQGIGTIANTFTATQIPADEKRQKEQAIYSTVMNGVSQVGPIGAAIGGISAVGDAVGTPIRNNLEKTDRDGNLKNKTGARVGEAIGGSLNPLKAGIESLNNSEATTGDKILSFTGLGALTGAYTRGIERRAKKAIKEKRDEGLAQVAFGDKAALETQGYKGYDDSSLYLAGGGRLKNIAPETVKVQGASHEQGGVNLSSGENVEAGEVIYKDKIFSKRLGTDNLSFADKASKIIKQNEKYKNYKNRFGANTAQRMEERTEKELNNLFQEQESFKAANNIPDDMGFGEEAAAGGKRKQYNISYAQPLSSPYTSGQIPTAPQQQIVPPTTASGSYQTYNPIKKEKFDYSPYAATVGDNIINLGLNLSTPEIPKPNLNRDLPLNTRYNAENAISTNKENILDSNRDIDANTANSNTAVARKMANQLELMKSNNQIYAQKENIETQLKNANIQNTQRVEAENNAILNEYKANKYQKGEAIRQRYSTNAANLQGDIRQLIDDKNSYKLDIRKLDLIKKQYESSNVVNRNLLDNLTKDEVDDLYKSGYIVSNGALYPIKK